MKANEQNRNYMRNQKNKLRIRLEEIEKSLKKQAQTKKTNEQKYGKQIHHNKINEGKEDRLLGKSPKVFDDESMQTAYSYGYYESGSRALDGEFSKGTFSEEKQLEFGMQDFINGVSTEYLKNLMKYPAYAYGRNYQMGKKAYDYITNGDMTFEEYVFSMELIFPEVKTEAFKLGYYAKKVEANNNIQEENRKIR